MNKAQLSYTILERARLVQESGLARSHQLGDSGNRGRKNDLASRHSLHEHYRHALGEARQAEDVGAPVVVADVVLADGTGEGDLVRQATVLDERLKGCAASECRRGMPSLAWSSPIRR